MKLHAHQQGIVEWILEHDRCAIWAPMGSGKTAATLCALSIIRMTDPGPVLVLAPKRVAVHTWPEEARKWSEFGLKVIAIDGSPREREKALNRHGDVYTLSYDNVPWLVKQFGDRYEWPFTTVVADESTRLKGFRTRQGGKRARELGKVAHTKVRRFIELTGTPARMGWSTCGGRRGSSTAASGSATRSPRSAPAGSTPGSTAGASRRCRTRRPRFRNSCRTSAPRSSSLSRSTSPSCLTSR
jgi:hypothetical protein